MRAFLPYLVHWLVLCVGFLAGAGYSTSRAQQRTWDDAVQQLERRERRRKWRESWGARCWN